MRMPDDRDVLTPDTALIIRIAHLVPARRVAAYTPGVAEPCRKIRENPDDVYKYTFKSNMVAANTTVVVQTS